MSVQRGHPLSSSEERHQWASALVQTSEQKEGLATALGAQAFSGPSGTSTYLWSGDLEDFIPSLTLLLSALPCNQPQGFGFLHAPCH